MAKKLVKCPYCSQTFDAITEPFVKVRNNTRYAHEECYLRATNQIDKINQEKLALEEYIKQLFGYKQIPYWVRRQIDTYVNEKEYTYSGILKTLKYFYEVKRGDIEKAHGGIGM